MDAEKALQSLKAEIEKKEKRKILNFDEYLEQIRTEPQKALRNIFQLFHDMVKSYVGEGKNEYPEDPENILLTEYDCSKIFEEGIETPFFIDRLFANRFVREMNSLTLGAQQNRILVFEGVHGCGKSTFMNNLLQKFQEYTHIPEGRSFEILWEIDIATVLKGEEKDVQKIKIPCPSHDYPILIIPKNYRVDFLDQLFPGSEFKTRIFNEKNYEWLFKWEACTICNSIFTALFEKLGSLDEVLKMVKARSYQFDRRLGEGITIFNPGDRTPLREKEFYLVNPKIQEKLDQIFGIDRVKYIFSPLAKTNNGVYVLMDIKDHNKDRLLELHNIISEGVRKAGEIEERINSLFLALMNPEDKKAILEEKTAESIQGRIQYIKIPYALESRTEVKIYRTIFGKSIDLAFMPRVLENFARVIISSRMNNSDAPLKEWIKDWSSHPTYKYKKYCDRSGLLLRMETYSGALPAWLSDEDKKSFTPAIKRKLIFEAGKEGEGGFTGRDSIRAFGDCLTRYRSGSKLITMANVADYFRNQLDGELRKYIPIGFIDSLVDWYDYGVLSEVKEAIYFYNEQQISEDILHYITAVNYDPESRVKCKWTGKEVEVTIEFLKEMASRISGSQISYARDALTYAQDIQKKYITQIVAQGQEKEITKTKLYQELFNACAKNLKEKVLQPFVANKSFREAVKAYGTKEFEAFDTRLREHVAYMIKNLVNKFGYTEQGAKEICLYVLDKDLARKFS